MRKQPITLKRNVFIRLLAITIAVVLLFYVIGLYLNFTATNNVRDGMQNDLDNWARYIAGEIERELGNLVVLQQELASDTDLHRYRMLYSILSDYQRIEYIKSISNQLWRITRFSSIVGSARVHLKQLGRTIAADKAIYDVLDENAWAQFSMHTSAIPFHMQEWNGQIFLLYTKMERKEPAFIIEVGISSEKLLSRLSSMRSDESVDMLLLHQDGTPFIGTQNAEMLDQNLVPHGQEYRLGNARYLTAQAEIPLLQMTLRCYSAMDAAMTPFLQHNLWIWALTLLAALLLIAYLLYYRHYILHPLSTIFESLRRAEKTGHFLIEQQNTDFDDIYAQFTAMVERLERLAGRVYEEQFRAQRAELRQLQMQINPHFFYNTLFMVYRLAKADGNEDIAQICLNLSNYYRYITKMPGHDVPLRDEVEHIRQYLDIQRIRFSPRITIHMDELPEAIANEKIPPLMLQPIVENAFVHGVKDRTSGGYVEMHYQYTENWYRVIVYDNGGHMDQAAVDELNRRIKCGELEAGSALQNLARRMELRYGSRYEMQLESYHHGLRVSITFPRMEGSKDDVPLVVDDEVIIADGLYQMLQETFQDELMVRRCYSFFEAQKILESNRVDILLTDIEMPDVSGLELHQWVRERWPMVRVIYLTGYSDFGYARQALQQQAMGYVLKSEGDQVIVQAIERAIHSLREESEKLLSRSRENHRSTGHLHQLIYHAMHGGTVTPEQFQQTFDESGLPFRADQPILLGYAYFEEQSPALQQSMGLIETLAEGRLPLLVTEMTSRALVLICQPQTPNEHTIFSGILDSSQFVLEKQNALMTVCLLSSAVPWATMTQAGEWMLEQLNRTSPAQGELLILQNTLFPTPAPQPVLDTEWPEMLDSLKRLNEYLLTGQHDLYFEEESRLWAMADFRHNRRQVITIGNALAMSLLHSVSDLPQNTTLRHQLESYNSASQMDLQQLPLQLRQFAEQFFALRGENKSNRQRTLISQVNKYIASHMDGDLSLAAIADAVHFHPVYLSRIYKEQAGVSLSDYIANQRLDSACALLRAPGASMSAVAKATGFSSSNYFSRWFRKKTGMTPQEYRDKTQRMG